MRDPRYSIGFVLALLIILAAGMMGHAAPASAADAAPSTDELIRGAKLYDKWYAVLGVEPPAGNMPIWSRQSNNTRSGGDTWRCSECHGWDYRGAQGEYKAGAHFTGFPDIYTLVKDLQVEDIINHLNGKIDPAHNFSPYLDETSIKQLANFLKFGIIDDAAYINLPTLKVINPDQAHGQQLFQANCVKCHGEDGKKITIQIEGFNEYLGSVANRDPWRFLHRTRFGVAGIEMPVGLELGWTPEDGRDVLAYAQMLPTGEIPLSEPTQNPQLTPSPQIGGPANSIWTGILTGIGIVLGMSAVSAGFIIGFLILAFLVVTILRKR